MSEKIDAKARYRASEKGRATELAYRLEYEARPEVKARKRARAQTPEGKLSAKAASEKYLKSEHGRAQRALYAKQYHPAKRYGITPEERAALEAAQGGLCAICNAPPKERKALAVDHCHGTGTIRGLLCDRCNMAIGLLDDNAERLAAAIAYLSRFNSQHP